MKQAIPPSIALLRGHGGDGELYVASATVSGGPAAHGGNGGGTTPEQLFAAAYAACFHGALMLLAGRCGITADAAEVTVTVRVGRDPADGLFVLASHVGVRMPGVPQATAAELVRNAERVCPYTKMAREGCDSIVTLVAHGD